jgi:hypothetical protein
MNETIPNQDQEATFGGIILSPEGKHSEKINTINRNKNGTKITLNKTGDVSEEHLDGKPYCHYYQFHFEGKGEHCKKSCSSHGIQKKWNPRKIQTTPTRLVNANQNSHKNFSRLSWNHSSSYTPRFITSSAKKSPFPNKCPLPLTVGNRSTPQIHASRVYSNIVSPCNIIQPAPVSLWKAKSINYTFNASDKFDSRYECPAGVKGDDAPPVPVLNACHRMCAPRQPAVQWAADGYSGRTEYCGFRAYVPKKDVVLEKLVNTPRTPLEKFGVKDLGVTYFLSDCNETLGKRHAIIPKSYTYNLHSPRH